MTPHYLRSPKLFVNKNCEFETDNNTEQLLPGSSLD